MQRTRSGAGRRSLSLRAWRWARWPCRRDRTRSRRPGIEDRGRRVRVLAFPPERHRAVLLLIRRACGAANGDRRRSGGTRAFQADQHCDRNRLPAGVEFHLRHVGGRVRGAQPRLDATGPVGHGPAGPRLPRPGGERFRRLVAQGPARSAALSCRRSLPW